MVRRRGGLRRRGLLLRGKESGEEEMRVCCGARRANAESVLVIVV